MSHLVVGLTFYDHMKKDNSKAKSKSSVKPSSFSRTSTLMKPTASQLAKKNQPRQMGDRCVFEKPIWAFFLAFLCCEAHSMNFHLH